MTNLLISKANTLLQKQLSVKNARFIWATAVGSAAALAPAIAYASVESSLNNVKNTLVGTLLPLVAVCGLGVAALSFVMGHPNARSHLMYAMFGAAVGFGAESIISFIRSIIS